LVVVYVKMNGAGHETGMGLTKNAYKISAGSEEAEWNTQTQMRGNGLPGGRCTVPWKIHQ
jgi:hypothetical protein